MTSKKVSKLEKKKLRSKVLTSLNQLTWEEKQNKNYLISKHLFNWLSKNFLISQNPLYKKRIIGGFYPYENEPNWINKEIQNLFSFAFPRFEDDQLRSMIYFLGEWDKYTELTLNGVSLKVPRMNSQRVLPDLILVPGIAFTKLGHRLGRGKGCFDRYLSQFKGVKVGICFEGQILDDLPIEKFDEKVDIIISDKEVVDCRQL